MKDKRCKNNVNKNDFEEKLDLFRELFREKGFKITPQRTAIYKALSNSNDHPSAETVYERVRVDFPNISFDTVNRTLLTLCELGLAFVVEGSSKARRFDADVNEHQHFKCIKCKRILDLYHRPFENIQLPEEVESGFKVIRKSIYIEGICNECLSKEKTDSQ
jgi:Fur family peroxide stress response transcriptional regulator